MILTDTGPIVALLNRNDPNHGRCLAAAKAFVTGTLITTLPCFTEAMYFLAKTGGSSGPQRLWALRATGKLIIHPWNEAELARMNVLMELYKDTPMDFADASLVATAESLGVSEVFTIDRHFYAYRIHSRTPFKVIPG